MNVVWRLGLLLGLALAPVGCAHQKGDRASGSAPSSPVGVAVPVPVSDAPLEKTPVVAAPADPAAADLSLGEEFDLLDTPIVTVSDPLGPWNRAMFQFNDILSKDSPDVLIERVRSQNKAQEKEKK